MGVIRTIKNKIPKIKKVTCSLFHVTYEPSPSQAGDLVFGTAKIWLSKWWWRLCPRGSKRGFTLIEMIVVIGVIGLALPVLFAIFFTILAQQVKIYRLSIVKREGDYVLNVIENIVRNNVRSLHSIPPTISNPDNNKVCVTAGSSYNYPYLQDKTTLGTWSRFLLQGDKIASESSVPPNASRYLTTDKIKVTSFVLTCEGKGPYTSPVVNISFTLQYRTNSNRQEDIATLNYQTKVKLRVY